MTREDIIRMAKEAEAWGLIDHDGIAALERFAKLVAEAEREECVKVVQEWLHGEWHNQAVVATLMIRERGAP